MSIRFSEVPTSLHKPGSYVELDTSSARPALPAVVDKICLIGQMTADATVDEGDIETLTSSADAATYFGRGSMLHRMALAALVAYPYATLYAVGLDDAGAGTAASGSFEFAVSGLTAGTLSIYIGDDAVEVAISADDDADAVAAAVEAALDAALDLPVTASSSTDTVTVTARHKGVLGNQLDLDYAFTGQGLTVTVTAMASGATDPDAQTALDAIEQLDCTIIVFPYNNATDLGELSDHLVARSDGVEQRPAVGVTAIDTTVSAGTTLATGLNDDRITLLNLGGTLTWAPELAAAYAAVLASESDVARPLNGLELKGVHAPDVADRLTRTEHETSLANGVATAEVGTASKVLIVRSVSTKTLDADGGSYLALHDIQVIRTLDYIRTALKTRIDSKYRRVKIADLARSPNTTDPDKIRADVLDVLYALESAGYVENVEDNQDSVVVERNDADVNRVDIQLPADVVDGLHILAARIVLTV